MQSKQAELKEQKISTQESKTATWITRKRNIVILAVLCTLLWGSAFPGVKIGYQLFQIEAGDLGGKLLFAGMRFTLAGMLTLLAAFLLHKKVVLPTKTNLKGILILGFTQTFVQYVFFYIGISNTTGSKGAIVNATGTFMTVILGYLCYKNEKLGFLKILGCVIGFLGIIIVNLGKQEALSMSLEGEGFLLVAAFTFAIGSIISKYIAKQEDPIILTGYQMTFGGILLILLALVCRGKVHTFSLPAGMTLLYLSLLSAIAFTIWMTLLKYNSVSKISIFNALVPVFGVILSSAFLGENIINLQSLLGLIFVSAGIYIVNKQKV